MSKPFLKWTGGKGKLLPQYKNLFPKDFTHYCEPFLGGGAVFFYLKEQNPSIRCWLNDANKELIDTYREVRDNSLKLLVELEYLQEQHSKDFYYAVRDNTHYDISDRTLLQDAARFIYLNKTCFNGLYRVNKKGEFNVPIGSYKNPKICDKEGILKASYLLKTTCLLGWDYEDFLSQVLPRKKLSNYFVYLDPPYHPVSKTSNFTTYTKDGFHKEDQEKLAEKFVSLHKKGAKLMLSNSDCEFIRELYKDFNIHEVSAARSINSNAAKRGKITELVITNY